MTTWRDILHPGDATDFFARRTMRAFRPETAEFCVPNAVWLAELSRLVYRHDVEENLSPQEPPRTAFLTNVGLVQRRFFLDVGAHTQAMLVERRDPDPFAVLAFRGTEQRLGDFLVDLRVGFTTFREGVGLHTGFAEALDSIWPDVDEELGRLTCPVFYTGHSLGAALATLAAARRPPRAVYAFGSPRVGNAAFVESLGSVPIHRVVGGRDLVTGLPPVALGFRHAGTLHRLHRAPVPFSFNPLTWFRHPLTPPIRLADHAPVNYVDRLVE